VKKSPPDDQENTEVQPAELLPVGKAELTLTPAAWAEVLFPPSATGRPHEDLWQHAAASTLHGWTHYESRTGNPIALTESVYRAALAAASGNTFVAHPDADHRKKD
jgi:hypothetical protein